MILSVRILGLIKVYDGIKIKKYLDSIFAETNGQVSCLDAMYIFEFIVGGLNL